MDLDEIENEYENESVVASGGMQTKRPWPSDFGGVQRKCAGKVVVVQVKCRLGKRSVRVKVERATYQVQGPK